MTYAINYSSDRAELIYNDVAKQVHLTGFDVAIAAVGNLLNQAQDAEFWIEGAIKKLHSEISSLNSLRQETVKYIEEAEQTIHSASQPRAKENEKEFKARLSKFYDAKITLQHQSEILTQIPSTECLERDVKCLEQIIAPFRIWVQDIQLLLNELDSAKTEAEEKNKELLNKISRAMSYMEDYFKVRI